MIGTVIGTVIGIVKIVCHVQIILIQSAGRMGGVVGGEGPIEMNAWLYVMTPG